MTFPVVIRSVNDSAGGMSKMAQVCRTDTPGVGPFSREQLLEAFELLLAVRTQTGKFAAAVVNRTWHTYAGRTNFDQNNVNSGLKILDEQAKRSGGFMTGNVFSNTQISNYIRSVRNIQCNGFAFSPGELRKADVKAFDSMKNLTGYRQFVAAIEEQSNNATEMIGYGVFHHNPRAEPSRRIHGWVLTEAATGKLLKVIHSNYSSSSIAVMERAIECFTMSTIEKPHPLLLIDGGQVTQLAPELEEFYDAECIRRAEAASLKTSGVQETALPSTEPVPTAPRKRPRP